MGISSVRDDEATHISAITGLGMVAAAAHGSHRTTRRVRRPEQDCRSLADQCHHRCNTPALPLLSGLLFEHSGARAVGNDKVIHERPEPLARAVLYHLASHQRNLVKARPTSEIQFL